LGRLPLAVRIARSELAFAAITVDGVAFEGISPSLSTTKISADEKSCAVALRTGLRLDVSVSRVDGTVKKNIKGMTNLVILMACPPSEPQEYYLYLHQSL